MFKKQIRKIIILSLVIIFAIEECSGIRFTSSPFINIFMHTNVFHLFLCCYCFWVMLRSKPLPNWLMLLAGLLFATIATYLSPYPFEGTSGILFAITGMMLSAYPTKNNYIQVGIAIAGCTMIQPTSWCVHIVPCGLGFLFYRLIKSTRYAIKKR